jgi:hypothetical protein
VGDGEEEENVMTLEFFFDCFHLDSIQIGEGIGISF